MPYKTESLGPNFVFEELVHLDWLWNLTGIGNPIVEIRRSWDRPISTMGFPTLVRWHLDIESGPWCWQSRSLWYESIKGHQCSMPYTDKPRSFVSPESLVMATEKTSHNASSTTQVSLDLKDLLLGWEYMIMPWHGNDCRITALCKGNPLVTSGFPSQRAVNIDL